MNMKIFTHNRGFAGIGLLAAIFFGAAGCQSFNGPVQSSLASVSIVNRPMADVQAAVTNVFTAHNFVGGATGTNEFIYTRPAGRMDRLAYGSYMFNRPVTVKVAVTTRQKNPALVVVGCNAWIVEAENDPTFQEIHPVGIFGRGPYEGLLQEIKGRLRP
jgi:hypothetical protein